MEATDPRPARKQILSGFYAILDTGYVGDSEWEYTAESLLAGGARLLQVRAKGDPLERVRELIERVRPATDKYGVPLIVNDHLDLAMEYPETGLHLGQDDGNIREARRTLGPDRVLGLSTHSLEQAREAIDLRDVLDYFAVGPVFPTATKPDYIPVGLRLVEEVAALSPPIPFFCIGGINRRNVNQVLAAGARGIVSVSDPLEAEESDKAARELVRLIEAGGAT